MEKNFRSYIISWLAERQIKAYPHHRGVRHEALLENHLRFVVEYDPLDPRADARLTVLLLALPYEEGKRVLLIEDMLRLNYKLLSVSCFTASICSYMDGEYIGLSAYAGALDEEGVYFEEALGRYFDTAFYAWGQLGGDRGEWVSGLSRIDDMDIRYL